QLERAATLATGSFLGLPYGLLVHTYSNLLLHATIRQKSYEPGAEVLLYASLTEYDLSVEQRATVWAEYSLPDGSEASTVLVESGPGRFEGSFGTTLPGVYTIRLRAAGNTFRGHPFTREQALTAAVWVGGDRGDGGSTTARWLCQLAACLLDES